MAYMAYNRPLVTVHQTPTTQLQLLPCFPSCRKRATRPRNTGNSVADRHITSKKTIILIWTALFSSAFYPWCTIRKTVQCGLILQWTRFFLFSNSLLDANICVPSHTRLNHATVNVMLHIHQMTFLLQQTDENRHIESYKFLNSNAWS
jgi:hypothetical protein